MWVLQEREQAPPYKMKKNLVSLKEAGFSFLNLQVAGEKITLKNIFSLF